MRYRHDPSVLQCLGRDLKSTNTYMKSHTNIRTASDQSPQARLERLLIHTPIVDTHNDFPYLVRVQLHGKVDDERFDFSSELTSHTSLPKLRRGKLGIQFFSAFIDCRYSNELSQDFNEKTRVVRDTIEQIDITERLVDKFPEYMEMVLSSTEALDVYVKKHKLAVTLGVEGLHQCDASIAMVRKYFHMGVRYITLTHNCDNPFATAASSVAGGLPDKGLTDLGAQCIKEMNRLGMLVDLSHVSYQTMVDALEVSISPVIFSHSSAYAVCPHRRNVPDDVLLKMRANGGVVHVNFFPGFIAKPGQKEDEVTIDDCVDHIFHIAEVAGWEHVGMGSDFDGIEAVAKGLEDVSKYPDLLIKCMERGATDEQIRGLMGGNILRVWKQNEDIAEKLKGSKPVDDQWADRKWPVWGKGSVPELFPGANDIYPETEDY